MLDGFKTNPDIKAIFVVGDNQVAPVVSALKEMDRLYPYFPPLEGFDILCHVRYPYGPARMVADSNRVFPKPAIHHVTGRPAATPVL